MQRLFLRAREVQVSRGELIDITDFVYFIKTGVIGQYAKSQNNQKLLFAYKDGEICPMSSSTQSNSSGRAYVFKALSKSTLLQLSKEEFDTLMQQPDNMKLVLDCALRVVQHQIERIDNLQEEQILQRLLERLIYIALRFGSRDGDSITIDIPMSHVDLATSINTSRETVNRYMKQLEQLGIISLKRQMIRITSLVEIQKMLDSEIVSSDTGKQYTKSLVIATLVASALVHVLNATSTGV